MYEATVYSVMIAAPGDVVDERGSIYRVLAEWNVLHSRDRDAALMPLHWTTHARPSMGERAQAIINEQVTNQSDLLIAVFRGRLGSPTADYSSGTVEEIEEHIHAGKPVMVYFSNIPVPPSELVFDEYQKVKDLRTSLETRGLYKTYDTLAEFEEKLRSDVSAQIQVFLRARRTARGGRDEPDIVLSPDATELLTTAAEDQHGIIFVTETFGGTQVQSNGREFAEQGNRRSESAWLAAVDQLHKFGLVEGDSRGISPITAAGYRFVDRLSEFGAGSSSQIKPLAPSADVRVEYWSLGPGPHGAGLVVHNIGTDVALKLEAQRLMPTGNFDVSRSLKSLNPSERGSFSQGWNASPLPEDAPTNPMSGQYVTRVLWEDRSGRRFVGAWTETEKDRP